MDKIENVITGEKKTDENVIEAFEKFVKNYELLDITFSYLEKDYTMQEMLDEMRNNTPVGKAYIQKIYYGAILGFSEIKE